MSAQNYLEEIRQVWAMVKDSFRDRLSETTINLWFGSVEINEYHDDIITMSIASEFKFKIIQDKYIDDITAAFCKLLGFDVRVNLIFSGSPTAADLAAAPTESSHTEKEDRIKEAKNLADFNFDYTFENFIVGSTNKFAHAACVAVANNPATNYNPLFIYGNSGLGKTHLLCAIRNMILERNPDAKIVLHGVSMGCATVTMMSGRSDLPENVKMIVADCGFNRATDFFRFKGKDMGVKKPDGAVKFLDFVNKRS